MDDCSRCSFGLNVLDDPFELFLDGCSVVHGLALFFLDLFYDHLLVFFKFGKLNRLEFCLDLTKSLNKRPQTLIDIRKLIINDTRRNITQYRNLPQVFHEL
jgi:hypothetical protein